MQRRSFILALTCTALAPGIAAPAGKVPKVGILITHAPLTDPVVEVIRSGFRALGYEDGHNIQLEFVTALARTDRLTQLAHQLASEPVDVIVAPNEMSARIAQQATREIPIVMFAWTRDPVELGLIASYARPGGNITGIHSLQSDLEVKRIELTKEALPRLSHLGAMRDPAFPRALEDIQEAARAMAVQLSIIDVGGAHDLEPAFRAAKRKGVGALLAMQSPTFYVNRVRISALSLQTRIPVVAGYGEQVRAGFLLSYGVDIDRIYLRTAYYVDRLLKGANPAELPVEQVSELKLSVNQKTAHALKLTLPESLMQRANEIIR
jgi:putative ABC transport system substrate-binding protein